MTSQMLLWIYIIFIPQYTTFSTLAGLMSGISNFVNWGGVSAPTPLLAESYLNGKKKLTQYYMAQTSAISRIPVMFLPAIIAVYGPEQILRRLQHGQLHASVAILLLHPHPPIPTTVHELRDSIQLGTTTDVPHVAPVRRGTPQDLLHVLVDCVAAAPERTGSTRSSGSSLAASTAHYVQTSSRTSTSTRDLPIKVGWWQTLVAPLSRA